MLLPPNAGGFFFHVIFHFTHVFLLLLLLSLPSDVKDYIRQRASNYDTMMQLTCTRTCRKQYGNPQAIMGYLKGVPELGVEAP